MIIMSNYHEKVLRAIYIKPRSRMELLFWPVLYSLWADLVRVEISLNCGTGLKSSPIVGTHSRPPRDLDKTKKKKNYCLEENLRWMDAPSYVMSNNFIETCNLISVICFRINLINLFILK